MSTEEFEEYREVDVERYAQDRARYLRRSIEEERAVAKTQFSGLLKDGVNTKGHFLSKVIDSETGQAVGSVWFHVDEDNKRAFLYDILVHEDHRGKGYGEAILKLLEEKLRQMNVSTIGLHVFADNSIAIRLYATVGYYTVSLNMQKDL